MLLVLILHARFYHAHSNGERLQQNRTTVLCVDYGANKEYPCNKNVYLHLRGRRLERMMRDTKNYLHTRRHLVCETYQHHATLCLTPSTLVSSCCKFQQILMLEIYSSFLLAISNSRDQSLGLFYAIVMRKETETRRNAVYGVIWAQENQCEPWR